MRQLKVRLYNTITEMTTAIAENKKTAGETAAEGVGADVGVSAEGVGADVGVSASAPATTLYNDPRPMSRWFGM
jgi:hypothetical protein